MKKAIERLHDVIFTPAIRYYRMPNPSIRYPRYPSPASEPIDHEENRQSYKTAFRDSHHMIRYHHDLVPQIENIAFVNDPISETLQEKLVRTGYLQKSQIDNQVAVAEAKQKYEAKEKLPAEKKNVVDDFGLSDKPISKENRESVSYFVRNYFAQWRDISSQECWLNDLDDIYNPTVVIYQDYDMGCNDAVLRQLKCDIEWHLDQLTQMKADYGQLPVFQSSSSFWQILDNSFSPQNIKQVQESIGDRVNDLSTTSLVLSHNVENYHGRAFKPFPIESKAYQG